MKIRQMPGRMLTGLFLALLLLPAAGCLQKTGGKGDGNRSGGAPVDWNDEVVYHVFLRSFYDSNGDRNGDLTGLKQKLGYLQELGVTTILCTPLYESGFYHNYFPTDYKQIDPEYGTMQDYLDLIRAVHRRDMKFLMDMETQYAQSGNKWFDDSYGHPGSQYSDFIYYSDSLNRVPAQIFMPVGSPLYDFRAWPGVNYNIVMLDLNNRRVRQWMKEFYASWVDPDGDGDLSDGVDGFRIDHIMDDLDDKGLFTNLYADFWKPIFDSCRSVNPDLFVVGEQADWLSYGDRMVGESGADAAFGFAVKFAVSGLAERADMYGEDDTSASDMDPGRIHRAVRETMKRFGDSTYFVNFIENHDVDRWATLVHGNDGLLRVGAVLNMLLPGIPSVYYGQELGLTGKVGDWGSDANHIPVREAFPWTPDPDEAGTAVFYKDTGPWWDSSFYNTGAARHLALSVQRSDPGSLWNFYRELIATRKKYEALRRGDYQPVDTADARLLAFDRAVRDEALRVFVNLSGEPVDIAPVFSGGGSMEPVAGNPDFGSDARFELAPYGFVVLQKR